MVVAKAKPHHAQKPYILEITKNAPVSGAFLCSMKDIRVSGIACSFDWLTEPIRRDASAGVARPAQGRHGIAEGYS